MVKVKIKKKKTKKKVKVKKKCKFCKKAFIGIKVHEAKCKKNPKKKNTQKQIRLKRIISENLGNITSGKNVKTMKGMMLEAGYSESVASQQSDVLEGIDKDPIVNKVLSLRDKALERADKLQGKAGYKDSVTAVEKLTKIGNLLSGKATERTDSTMSDEQFDKLLNQASKRNSEK